eukprot:UN34503
MVNRLIKRRQHLLALHICNYLDNLRSYTSRVLQHWAVCKIEEADETTSDDDLLQTIMSNIHEYKGVSYAHIARQINEYRQTLAINYLIMKRVRRNL